MSEPLPAETEIVLCPSQYLGTHFCEAPDKNVKDVSQLTSSGEPTFPTKSKPKKSIAIDITNVDPVVLKAIPKGPGEDPNVFVEGGLLKTEPNQTIQLEYALKSYIQDRLVF